jgi:predicted nucleic acid-binding protein
MSYLLDANVFIQAKNLHYGFDFCPAFWDWLSAENRAGRVFSIEKVKGELQAGNDYLATWASEQGSEFFLAPDVSTLAALSRVSRWIANQGYHPAAVNAFLQLADFYIVSQALALGYSVVTQETPGDGFKKVKIPNPCIGLGINCLSPFEMLRREHARFVLAPQR